MVYSDHNDNEPELYAGGDRKPIKWLPDATHSKRGKYDNRQRNGGTGTGFARFESARWAEYVPIRVKGMVKAGEKLFIAGPPDVLDEDDPLGAFESRNGAVLRRVDPAIGETLADTKMDFPPVFDGMSAAHGALYVSDVSGTVHRIE